MGKGTQKLQGGSGRRILREFSAGGVVFKKDKNGVLWLVCRNAVLPGSHHPPNTWRLPKGWLDDAGVAIPGPLASGVQKATEEELQKTALKEVAEEGGIEARIVKKIGTIKFPFNSVRGMVLKFVTFYLMEYIRDLPGGFSFETEEVLWLSYNEAVNKLSYQVEKEVLKKAKDLLV